LNQSASIFALLRKVLRALRSRRIGAFLIVGSVVLAGAALAVRDADSARRQRDMDMSSQSRRVGAFYRPTDAEWTSFAVGPVIEREFRSERVTEGKIAVDDDLSTPIFSPYAGRVTRLLAKPGEIVSKGQPLFVIEATDMVQAQNDFLTALAALNKAQSTLSLAQIEAKRSQTLYATHAIAQRDMQQAELALTGAQNDVHAADAALEATRNRLRILGHTDDEIATFQTTGKIDPQTTIFAPIGGTIVQRKIGPGQYISTNATDPAFVIGDLSKVWLMAFVRETDAPQVQVGQDASFTVLAFPDRAFAAKIDYVAASLDPTARRLLARATIDNPETLLKPEMFASVSIFTGAGDRLSPAVPRAAVVYEADTAHVWVVHNDNKTIELRYVRTGMVGGDLVQITGGLAPGEQVVTRGSLFIDRAAGS
jgi:cobalt-zinc-cadmium efflux system membrane fusion protein